MSEGSGSAQFGRVDSASWDKDISQLVFMKSGIPPPEATSFWKLQNSTETEQTGNSGMFDSVEAASSCVLAPVASAATSHVSEKSDSAPIDSHAMDSTDDLLLEREVPARAFRSAAAVDSGSSVASMLEPRDRNSFATEFRSSSGTDLQVNRCHPFAQNWHLPTTPSPKTGIFLTRTRGA